MRIYTKQKLKSFLSETRLEEEEKQLHGIKNLFLKANNWIIDTKQKPRKSKQLSKQTLL